MSDHEKKDIRVSGPLDMRLANIDFEDRSVPPERFRHQATQDAKSAENDQNKQTTQSNQPEDKGDVRPEPTPMDYVKFKELLEEFRQLIDMPELELEEPNCFSIQIGEHTDNNVLITVELRAANTILLFTTLEVYPDGVTPELAARTELISAAIEVDGYYLSTSKHSVFLCIEARMGNLTTIRFGDMVTDFYKRALEWLSRYRAAMSAQVVANANQPVSDNQTTQNQNQNQNQSSRTVDPIVSASLRLPSRGLKV